MKFVFRNIDGEYVKVRPEYMGDIQPKFWFSSQEDTILVKRQHSQKVVGQQQKSKMFNHFGEYFGYLLAEKAGVTACPADIITLHDKKNKYSSSIHLYPACSSLKVLKKNQTMILGETVVGAFANSFPEKYHRLLSENNCTKRVDRYVAIDPCDNIDVIIAAIVAQTIHHEKCAGKRTDEEIKQDVHENLEAAFDMFAYDCIFGNNDRHSHNWAMFIDSDTGRMQMYPLYDNERVLGLSHPEAEVRHAVRTGDLQNKTEELNFSRMGTAPSHSGISYKNLLEHLASRYPEYALPAIKKITDRVTIQDIKELYDSAEGMRRRSQCSDELSEKDELPKEYRTFGVALFSDRRKFARNLLERYKFIKPEDRETDELLLL